jgi:C4-dicarboxylate-specific signal transduction histidine kinase
MLDRKLQSWFYPEPTGDVGRDRNARTLQFACLLYAFAFALVAVLETIERERVELPILVMAVVALVAAAAMNRAGMSAWAARIAILAGLLTAILLVLEARDGFRSHAMLVFPGLLLTSMMLLDRKSYVTTGGIVLLTVAALGIAERHGLTGAIRGIRTPPSYDSIFYVDLTLAIFAVIGSRIVSDAQRNVFDLRASVERLSVANLELTKTAEALRRSESLARARTAELQAIMDAAPAVILVANDAECRHVSGNQTAYAIMRQKPGTNLSMAAPEGERPTNRRVMQDGIEIPLTEMPLHKAAFTGQPFRNYDLEVVFEDGTSIDLLGNVEPIPDEKGVPRGVVAVLSDITERKRAEAALRKSEQRLKNAERLARIGHWECDLRTNRISGSEEMFRIFGKPQNYVPSYEQFLQDLVPQDRGRVERLIRDSIEKKIGYSTDYQIALPSGELGTISCIGEVLLDEEGLPVRIFGTCQDVTDQRQAEVSMRRSLDEIAHLNRVAAMGELTASLAHELNQPLAAILLNSEAASRFLSKQPPDLARVRDCLNAIAAEGERAGEMIKRIRGLMKKGESQASLVYLNEVVTDALRLLESDSSLRLVSVKFEPLSSLPPVLGDRIQLYQVVLNLIMNGLDAVAERQLGDRWVSVRTARTDGGGVELAVEDSGKGITEGDLARVFEPFFTTKKEGLGMGLSISRSIVEAHGGRIWAENTARHGAIFHCVLPMPQQAAVAAAK